MPDFPAGKSRTGFGFIRTRVHRTRGGKLPRVPVQVRSEQWAVATRLRRVTPARSHFPVGKWLFRNPPGAQVGVVLAQA